MALTSVIGCCQSHDAINAVSLFGHTLCVNSLFACYVIALIIFQKAIEMNVNISNEFNFAGVHGDLTYGGE